MPWTFGRLAACAALLLGAAFAVGHASCAPVTGLASDPCRPSSPPSRPPSSAGADGPNVELALRGLRFAVDYAGDGGSVSVGGLDLNHACSREDGTPTTCIASPLAAPHKDDSKGVDDAMGWLLVDNQSQLSTYLTPNTDPRVTLLLRLTGYNGKPDDDEVYVDAFTTAGVEPLDVTGTPTEPSWDGSDNWTISCETLASCDGGGAVLAGASDPHAYVSGGVLVVSNLGFLPVALSFEEQAGGYLIAVMNLSDPVLVARLTHGDAGIEVHGGILGARWPTGDMLAAIAAVGIPPEMSKRFVCPGADLASHAKLDGTGHPCDAFSIGLAFDAYPATITANIVPIVYSSPRPGDAGDCP